jgi:hypothetical protein
MWKAAIRLIQTIYNEEGAMSPIIGGSEDETPPRT